MKSVCRLAPLELVAGVDEAGRGPLAGPVVIAAVILDPQRPIEGLADSKILSAGRRDALALQIRANALAFAVIAVDTGEIERLNILGATLIGMTRSLQALVIVPTLALIDGNRLPDSLPCPALAIVGGDASEASISAASILAKTTRDRIMCDLDAIHPGYGFARHKGYGTAQHLQALALLGPSAVHRRRFAPIQRLLTSTLF